MISRELPLLAWRPSRLIAECRALLNPERQVLDTHASLDHRDRHRFSAFFVGTDWDSKSPLFARWSWDSSFRSGLVCCFCYGHQNLLKGFQFQQRHHYRNNRMNNRTKRKPPMLDLHKYISGSHAGTAWDINSDNVLCLSKRALHIRPSHATNALHLYLSSLESDKKESRQQDSEQVMLRQSAQR